jgi:predicted enzyme related to lactoylglutathione lyase
MPKIIHFEIPVDEPERAIKFYTEVFGWKIEKMSGSQMEYWTVNAGDIKEPGINGAMMTRGQDECVVDVIGVTDIDEYIKKIKSGGGKILRSKTAVHGVGYMAYFGDTEGNKLGIFCADAAAK